MEEWVQIHKYSYKANAIYAESALSHLGINSLINEVHHGHEISYEVTVNEEFSEKATQVLQKLELDDTPVSQESEGFIEGLDEWNKNMYNPGYYTGHLHFT